MPGFGGAVARMYRLRRTVAIPVNECFSVWRYSSQTSSQTTLLAGVLALKACPQKASRRTGSATSQGRNRDPFILNATAVVLSQMLCFTEKAQFRITTSECTHEDIEQSPLKVHHFKG